VFSQHFPHFVLLPARRTECLESLLTPVDIFLGGGLGTRFSQEVDASPVRYDPASAVLHGVLAGGQSPNGWFRRLGLA